MSSVTVRIGLIVLGICLVGAWASPALHARHGVYVDTCQESCNAVSNADEAEECREKFCPQYVNYLLTGVVDTNAKPTLASTHQKEVKEFCATWMVYLIDQIGWQNRIPMNLNKCMCAAGKDCLAK